MTNLLVIRNNSASVGIIPAEDHVTTGLAAKYEAGMFRCLADFSTRKVCREFGQGPDSLLKRLRLR